MSTDLISAPSDAETAQQLEAQVRQRLDQKTKPPGSLGRLEDLVVELALAQNRSDPVADQVSLLLFAADHGLVEAGVSAWPQDVTAQMVANFRAGGAAANVLARAHDVELVLVDAGVATDLPPGPDLKGLKIASGTRNALIEDAMSADQCDQALEQGALTARAAIEAGAQLLCLGEMGIGNTSSATLIAHALTGVPLYQITGRGAGLDAAGVDHKRGILEQCVSRRPGVEDGRSALIAFGGFEIAMMTGAILEAARQNVAVIVDGFIVTAAALLAHDLDPDARRVMIFGHRSAEPGHEVMLKALKARPLLDMQMRLGEGSGALMAVPLVRAASAILADMATFDSAGVSGKADQ